MEILNEIIDGYGIAALVLLLLVVVLFVEQVVSLCRMLIVAKFKQTTRTQILQEQPPVSVVVPLFGEDEEYLKGNFRNLLSQSSAKYEVVAVYVGKEDSFYATLNHLRRYYNHLKTTQIDYNPQYPISMRMALNLGVKSASNECVIFTTSDTRPATTDWAYAMARGFMYGDIVLGYCNWARKSGMQNLFFRKHRFAQTRNSLVAALRGNCFGASISCLGFTKSLYFKVGGFGHLDLTAGEDDLFVQSIATADNVCVPLCEQLRCEDNAPGSLGQWILEQHRLGQTRKFYNTRALNVESCELIARLAFFVAAIGALATLPLELKGVAALFILVRYLIVSIVDAKCAARVGDKGICAWAPLYDFFEPWVQLVIRTSQPKRISRWK